MSRTLPSRRTFVKGLAAGGVVTAFGLWRIPAWAQTPSRQLPTLTGTDFELTIGEQLVNFTGCSRTG